MSLLLVILVCCVIGVTIVRGERSWELIFSTLWFNALLVLLVVNVGCCFFGRIWGRKLTLISLGMILFHLSFVAMFAGIIYNSLFYFRGSIRLTEGETLPSGELMSYDLIDLGRYFDLSKLKGETTLMKMHTGYKVDNADKRAAYEIRVGVGNSNKQGIIYITKNLDYNGFTYLPDQEGYSLLIMLYDKHGRALYGGYIPLQSLKQKDGAFLYTTGTKGGPGTFQFPQNPLKPLFELQVIYFPSVIKERAGEVLVHVWSLAGTDGRGAKSITEGKAAIGNKIRAGDYSLSAMEVRYWTRTNVRYEPGKPIVLTSLWAGLAGMVITTIGRMRKSSV
jgi:cytochrome c biogenesis protein ResB